MLCKPDFQVVDVFEVEAGPAREADNSGEVVQKRCAICISRWSNDLFWDLPRGAPCMLCLAGA